MLYTVVHLHTVKPVLKDHSFLTEALSLFILNLSPETTCLDAHLTTFFVANGVVFQDKFYSNKDIPSAKQCPYSRGVL